MQGIIVAPNGDVWAVDTMKGQVVHFSKGDPAKGELYCQKPARDAASPATCSCPAHIGGTVLVATAPHAQSLTVRECCV
jgi:hypothetical protein